MSISKSTVIKIVLSYIGGAKLQQLNSHLIAGSPVACKAGGLSSALTSFSSALASAAGGLEEGLTAIYTNPLLGQISTTRSLLEGLVPNNFSGMDSQLSYVAGNPSLSTEYGLLKEALGGADGLSGSVSQLDRYHEHTDRLSGVTLSSDSSANSSSTIGEQYQEFFNIDTGTTTEIISFDAKTIRSAKYFVQGSAGVEHQTSEIFIVHDNSIAYTREIDQIYTREPFIVYTSQLQNNVVTVFANTSLANTSLVVYGVNLPVIAASSASSELSQDKILESAKAMAGFYPDDTTDYVQAQASALFDREPLSLLERDITDTITLLSATSFQSLSTAEQQAKITELADLINSRNQALQATIDSDLAAHQSVNKQIEAASIMTTIDSSYSIPTARALLDLTLTDEVKASL